MNTTRAIGIHHIAFATRNAVKTYEFYHDCLGMRLVRTEWARVGDAHIMHFFFDIGGGQHLAFFEMHGAGEKSDFRTDINRALGLPTWVNHVAFRAPDLDSYEALKQRCVENGVKILSEADHGWCMSFYFQDPNGITLEFSYDCDPEGFTQDPDIAYEMLRRAPAAIAARRDAPGEH